MQPPFESDLIRSFLALAEMGSVTGAAERLGRTQSAVSMQLRRLEEGAGQPLFTRQPRGVALTPAGVRLMPFARQVVALLDQAGQEMRGLPLARPLRIGLPPEYCETLLPCILERFAPLFPQVEVTVRSDYSTPSLAALERGELDLAVVFDGVARPGQGEVLAMDPTVWVTSLHHNQHLRHPLPIAVYLGSCWCDTHMRGGLEQRGIAYREAFACDTTPGFWAALRSGLAVVALARSTIPEGCRELTEADGFPLVDASCLMLHRHEQAKGPAVDGLVRILHAVFAEALPGKGGSHAARV